MLEEDETEDSSGDCCMAVLGSGSLRPDLQALEANLHGWCRVRTRSDLVVGRINRFLHLKVLSSEMDPTEIRLIR
jgi:hypothetical protein